MRVGQIFGRIVGTAALLGIAFVGGVTFQDLRTLPRDASVPSVLTLVRTDVEAALVTAAHGQTSEYTPYEMYADVLATLKANYYGKDIDPTQMTYNGIRGMMGSVHDRYTRFLDPTAYKEMMDDNHGEFVGIGALLGTNKANQVYVVRVLPNSPALRARVMAGDIIVKVNDAEHPEDEGHGRREAHPGRAEHQSHADHAAEGRGRSPS